MKSQDLDVLKNLLTRIIKIDYLDLLLRREAIERLTNRLRGKIAQIQSVNLELGTKFLKEFNSIQWPDK